MTDSRRRKPKHSFNMRSLRLSLKYRPEILNLILRLKLRIIRKDLMIEKLNCDLEEMIYKYRFRDELCEKDQEDIGTETDITLERTVTANNEHQSKHTESSDTSKSKETEAAKSVETKDQTTQTEEIINKTKENASKIVKSEEKPEDSGWNINDNKETKSIAEQVAEVAQDALKESGMVYVDSAGMYYDYKTGYYYNSVQCLLFFWFCIIQRI